MDEQLKSQSRPKRSNMRQLPVDFEPSEYTVVVGNGSKASTNATGNQHFQSLVEQESEEYHNASGRAEKSSIVSHIYETLQHLCPGHSPFVKRDGKGTYWELSERAGREKTTATFRNLKGKQYKSSTANKVARKRQARRERKVERAQKRQRRIQNFSRAILNGEAYRPVLEPPKPCVEGGHCALAFRESKMWTHDLFQEYTTAMLDHAAAMEPISKDIFDDVHVDNLRISFSDESSVVLPSMVADTAAATIQCSGTVSNFQDESFRRISWSE